MKIIYLGTNFFSSITLELLLKNNIKINYIICKKAKKMGRGLNLKKHPTELCALKYKIPIQSVDSVNTLKFKSFLQQLKPDLIILIEYFEKINIDIINIPKYGILNIHPSILPQLKGATPIQSAIINNFYETGVTIININNKLDSGDIISIIKYNITKHENYNSLFKKLIKLSFKTLLHVLKNINIKLLQKQNTNHISYTYKFNKNFYKINWFDSAGMINRKIRSTFNLKKHYANINNIYLNILMTCVIINVNKIKKLPGTIIKISNLGIDVITGFNILRIKKIQFSGKKIISIADFFNSKNKKIKINFIFNR